MTVHPFLERVQSDGDMPVIQLNDDEAPIDRLFGFAVARLSPLGSVEALRYLAHLSGLTDSEIHVRVVRWMMSGRHVLGVMAGDVLREPVILLDSESEHLDRLMAAIADEIGRPVPRPPEDV